MYPSYTTLQVVHEHRLGEAMAREQRRAELRRKSPKHDGSGTPLRLRLLGRFLRKIASKLYVRGRKDCSTHLSGKQNA